LASVKKVIIVGAGLAGLTCACFLRKSGFDVDVLEAASHPGGRAAGRELEGFHIDLGANLFLEAFATASQIADEIGVPLKRTPVPIHSGIYRNGRFHGLYGGNRLASQVKTARTMLSFQLLSPKGVWQSARFAKMLQARRDDLSFDDHSKMLDLDTDENASEFLKSKIGTEPLEWIFGPGLMGYMFAQPEQIGAAYAMATLWHVGLNGDAWPVLPDGGMAAFVDALVKACGSRIKLNTPVRRVVLENAVAKGVVTDHGLMEADVVVCATTASAVVEITPNLPSTVRDTLQQVTYSKCCRVFFGVNSSPFPPHWYAVSFPRQTGAQIIGMSNLTVLNPELAPQGTCLIDALAIGRQAEKLFGLEDQQVKERVLSEVRRYVPQMHSEPFFTHVHRWPEAVCLSPGGTMTRLYRMQQKELGTISGLFLAGDYLGLPSVNAALRSGLDAARAAVEYLH